MNSRTLWPSSTVATVLGVSITTVLIFASGWAIGTEHTDILLITTAVVLFCILAATQRGGLVGLLLLAVMNGLPAIDTSASVLPHLTGQDVAVCILIGMAGVWAILDYDAYCPSPINRTIAIVARALLLWWFVTLLRTTVESQVPLAYAAAFGKDFLFYGLLLLILPRVRFTNSEVLVLLAVLTAGVCVFAVGQIAIAVGMSGPGALVHAQYTLNEAGFVRVYANINDLVTAGLAVSLAATLIARQTLVRAIAAPVALLLTLSTVLQLTRARWLGLLIGLILVSSWIIARGRGGRARNRLRKRLGVLCGVIGVVGCLVIIAAIANVPGILSGGAVTHRIGSIFSDLESAGGTLAVRNEALTATRKYLAGEWLAGLGFIPPSSHYYNGLPEGSLRDTDLGVLNGIVTMGLIGAILIYLPVILTLAHCLRRCVSYGRRDVWLVYGGAIWATAALFSSLTLVTLFSVGGLCMAAVLVTVLIHPYAADVRSINVPGVANHSFAVGPGVGLWGRAVD